MIRRGLLCKHCTNKSCNDLGTETEPIEIECPACDGNGCDECNLGAIKIMGCPNTFCREVTQAVNLADLFEKGMPPISGGALDQSAWFIESVRVLSNEESALRAESYE